MTVLPDTLGIFQTQLATESRENKEFSFVCFICILKGTDFLK